MSDRVRGMTEQAMLDRMASMVKHAPEVRLAVEAEPCRTEKQLRKKDERERRLSHQSRGHDRQGRDRSQTGRGR
ncbi:hypothetical protein AB0C34_16905 [Nocardia sp. NPDC049220]|uniref:hypothetical protein n=1 Tax=Nocardia sp. NPDC049220 TaxID=3155273 RepID=UPI003403C4E0